ncbi:MAG: rRNA maturation RNase YbeY [Thermomicrobiales bacterium]
MGDFPLPNGLTRDSLHSLIVSVLTSEGASGKWEIGLMLISDEVIQDLHRDFMGLDLPTDIITFPYETESWFTAESLTAGGDIVISMETATVNATEAGWKPRDELEFLVVHGILHILEWDDADAESRAAMLARQTALIAEWRAQDSGNGP